MGHPLRSATAVYTVNIKDENDNAPIFTATTYRAYIKENSAVGASVVTVRHLMCDSII